LNPEPAQFPAKACIVVIDDEPLSAAALTEFLRQTGHTRVNHLPSHQLTAQALNAEQPDLVLLELSLNPAAALAVLGWMKADRTLRHVPVVVLSAQDEATHRLQALELGAADYLVKPVEAAELQLRLRNTLAMKAYRDQLARTDNLTGLPNRESLLWQLDWAVKNALRQGGAGAVLQLGLVRFGQVNDALGPAVGDELLHAVAQRLVTSLRESDVVTWGPHAVIEPVLSRGSGDEFTMLLPTIERPEDAAAVAERMMQRMSAPFLVAGHELFVSCRIGIAVFPADSNDKDTVLKHAGVAMRHVHQGSQLVASGYQFYSEELNAESLQRLRLERELHHALERGEFRVYYQPQVECASGRVCGAEALVRWQHPERGLLGPGEFITVAEHAGLIARLGDWVLREALLQLARWRQSGLQLSHVAVNVSSLQLQHNELLSNVQDALHRSGIEPAGLCLEITESAIIDSKLQVASALAAIKDLGVKLALDDFGTGYSSLTYLCRFPIDELKIDRSFVTDCDNPASNTSTIAAAIIAMACRLGLRVVAEGVETPEQLAFVRASGAHFYQGYLFAKPVPALEFGQLLQAQAAPN
jgi:diguanylate cyclase